MYLVLPGGRSGASSGALVQPLPLLRRKLPELPAAFRPVPPFVAGTTPRDILGVVAGFVTNIGLVAVTLVTLPSPWGPVSPFWARIVQSGPSTGTTFVLARTARQDEPLRLTASSST